MPWHKLHILASIPGLAPLAVDGRRRSVRHHGRTPLIMSNKSTIDSPSTNLPEESFEQTDDLIEWLSSQST